MTFQSRLFHALASADEAMCNDVLVVSKLLDPDGALPPFVDLADGKTINIEDAVITIDDEGRAYGQQGKKAIVWKFRAMQPLTAACVPTIEAPRPRVSEVVDRLRNIGGPGGRRAG